MPRFLITRVFTVFPHDHGYLIVLVYAILIYPMSCSSPRWDNLPSGHQRNPLLGLFGVVHVLGSKILF